jgi:hypothetical protein
VDAALVGAWCTGLAGIIAAIGVVVKIVLTRPRVPVAEEVLLRLAELEDVVLRWASWAHDVRVHAAAQGWDLPEVDPQLIPGRQTAPVPGRRRTDTMDIPVPPRTRMSADLEDERRG